MIRPGVELVCHRGASGKEIALLRRCSARSIEGRHFQVLGTVLIDALTEVLSERVDRHARQWGRRLQNLRFECLVIQSPVDVVRETVKAFTQELEFGADRLHLVRDRLERSAETIHVVGRRQAVEVEL